MCGSSSIFHLVSTNPGIPKVSTDSHSPQRRKLGASTSWRSQSFTCGVPRFTQSAHILPIVDTAFLRASNTCFRPFVTLRAMRTMPPSRSHDDLERRGHIENRETCERRGSQRHVSGALEPYSSCSPSPIPCAGMAGMRVCALLAMRLLVATPTRFLSLLQSSRRSVYVLSMRPFPPV